jgi:hypothetical protein
MRQMAEEIGQETFEQPPFNALVLVHKWGRWDIRMIVRNLGSGIYHIVFAMSDDLKSSGDVDADMPEGYWD